MLGAERIRGIVAGLEMKYARTRWRSDNLRGDHDRSVHAPPRIPVLEPGCLEPAPGTERGPLQLIDARTGIMPFADRDELTALIDWACAPQAGNGRDLALAVVTGAGGSGRTRLAVELCSALGRNGWGTGFVPDPADLGDADADLAGRDLAGRDGIASPGRAGPRGGAPHGKPRPAARAPA